jgi:hypothetical protein
MLEFLFSLNKKSAACFWYLIISLIITINKVFRKYPQFILSFMFLNYIHKWRFKNKLLFFISFLNQAILTLLFCLSGKTRNEKEIT